MIFETISEANSFALLLFQEGRAPSIVRDLSLRRSGYVYLVIPNA